MMRNHFQPKQQPPLIVALSDAVEGPILQSKVNSFAEDTSYDSDHSSDDADGESGNSNSDTESENTALPSPRSEVILCLKLQKVTVSYQEQRKQAQLARQAEQSSALAALEKIL